jgi:hypothetical protein
MGLAYSFSREIGMNVMHAYAATKMPAQQTTTMDTVGLVFERYTRRPAKKRNRERCRREGGQHFNHGRNTQVFDAIGKECTDARALVSTIL